MENMFTSIALPVVLFGILVFIHELGHFTVAKLSGVYVERFALGFGPAVIKKQWGETEYAICLLPLGGYVKMRGEEPDDEKGAADPRSFAQKPVWTRIAIVAMGPISNLLLPVVLFSALFVAGSPVPAARIGSVIPGYPADKAGLRAGDTVVSVEGKPVSTWNEMTGALRSRGEIKTTLRIERGGKENDVALTPVVEPDQNIYGEIQPGGKIGVDLQPYRPAIGVSDPSSAAAKAGLQTGDIIVSLNGAPVSYGWQFTELFSAAKGTRKIGVERITEDRSETKAVELPGNFRSPAAAGIQDGELFIRQVQPGSIADQKGLQPGDKLVSLNGAALDSWYAFRKQIHENTGEKMTVGVARGKKTLSIDLIPGEVEHKDEFTREKRKTRQLGVISCAIPAEPAIWIERYTNPLKALARGLSETAKITRTTAVGMAKLVSGKLSMNSLGGPISIFYLAGSSYKAGGWTAFIRMMAILSITLGVLNFLPVPVLDGGHLFFFLIEAVKGSPVHRRVQQAAQQVGMAVVIGLMVLTFYVDINRYFVERIKAFFN